MSNLKISNNDARLPAALVTILATALVVLLLVMVHMGIDPTKPWPPEPDPYIELAVVDEFVEPEPVPLPSNAPDALDAPAQLPEDNMQDSKIDAQSGTHLENRGEKAEPAKTVTTPKPSPVKKVEEPQPAKTGPAVENSKPKDPPAAKNTKNESVKNAFGGKNNANTGTNDDGKSGVKNGNPNSGGPANSTSKTVGMAKGHISGGWGWPYIAEFKNPTNLTGTIVVEFVVDRSGKPTVKSITGLQNSTLRAKCRSTVEGLRFTNKYTDPNKIPELTTAKLTFSFI